MRPDSPLDQLFQPRQTAPLTFHFDVPDGWQQGRGAFGGLVVALLTRALEAGIAAPDRRLRSITSELPGPTLPGDAEVRVEILRAGNAVTTAAARLIQNGETQAHAVGVFGKARNAEGTDAVHLQPPVLRPWREMEVLPVEPPLAPEFSKYFEYRSEVGLPFSGQTVPHAEGWIRPKNPGSQRDSAFVVACMDAWYPVLLAALENVRPMATVAFTLQQLTDLEGLDPEQPLLFRSKDVAIRDGFFVELRELWGHDGRLIALNQQTFAIIK